MQGNSESWRRLDRMRAASAGPAGCPSPDEPPAGVVVARGVVEPMRPAAPSERAVAEAVTSGPTEGDPVAGAVRGGRHAARSATAVTTIAVHPDASDDGPVRRWVPDDDTEGPVVGADLDRWIARRAAIDGSAGRPPAPDGVDDADRSAADGSPDEGLLAPTDSVGRDGGAGSEGEGRNLAGPARGRRPVSRWRARLHRSLGRGAELWVPEPLRGARVDPGRRGAMALLLVAALAAAITAVGVWRDRPEARPVATVTAGPVALASADPPSSSTRAGPEATSDGGGPTVAASVPAAEIVVSVTGLVARPGVVTLPGDARVADAVAAAGGLVDGADVTGLNLAAKLTDGASVVVGAAGSTSTPGDDAGSSDSGGGSSTGSSAGRVDLNTADADELDTLPGVGPVMAANIIDWRETNGRFASVDQLQEISGIGPARYAQLSELVTVS